MNLFNALNNALERHEFFLTYQPIFNLHTKKMVGMEALIRWQHPTLGLISPNTFIPLAEKNGLIPTVSAWVIKTVCEQARLWQIAGYNHFTIAINISPFQLTQPDLPEKITNILHKAQVSPSTLVFEITETAIIPQSSISEHVLKKIHAMGIGISIDDFGTGYSSLVYLSRLPVTSFKIDKSFIQNIPASDNDIIIVNMLIRLGKDLGLTVIAEGIEKEEHLKFLIEKNCPQGQGDFLRKPLNINEITALLKKEKKY